MAQQSRSKNPPPEASAGNPGPSPLPLQMGLASLIWLSSLLLWQRLQHGSTSLKPGWSPALQPAAAKLRQASAKLPPEQFAIALMQEGMKRYKDYCAGVTIYRGQSVAGTEQAEMPVIAASGVSRLLDYAPDRPQGPAALIIPSLVNRYHILDLSAQHSLLRWLAAQGIRPILVDWGKPDHSECGMTIAAYVQRLRQVFLPAAQQCAGLNQLHLLGHCLGGNLALALAASQPRVFASLTLLSTPWDFHAGPQHLGENAAVLWRSITAMLQPDALVPPVVIQSLFAMLQPLAVTEKFRQLALGRQPPAKLQHFARVERWLNDGVPLPQPVMREIVEDWYGKNLPARGGWRAGDVMVRPRSITCPTLLAIPQHDHLVPPASAAALARQLPCAQSWSMPLGHIGLIISQRARGQVWRRLADWMLQHN